MTPAYIRWRCERLEQLLRFHSRKSALEIIAGEALEKRPTASAKAFAIGWAARPEPTTPAARISGLFI